MHIVVHSIAKAIKTNAFPMGWMKLPCILGVLGPYPIIKGWSCKFNSACQGLNCFAVLFSHITCREGRRATLNGSC